MSSDIMDPDVSKVPGLALPNSSPESGVRSAMPSVQSVEGTHEVMMPQIEVVPIKAGGMSPAMPSVPPMPTATAPIAQAPTTVPVDPATASVSAPDETDSDNLDVEWVNKAKAIVEQTKNDPHLESNELSKVKADYLRIRYNKNIKVVEESR